MSDKANEGADTKFEMSNAKALGTPMSPATSRDKNEEGKPVDESKYRGMIGSLFYLTSNRPDIVFSVCRCTRFQATPKESYLTIVKQIIRYLIGTTSHGLWYPRLNNFKLKGFQTQIFQEIKMTRKAQVELVNYLKNCLFPGTLRNMDQLHYLQMKLNTLPLDNDVVNYFG
ncbi:PREDICTED: uncharacterized protein LOC109211109 [Nicotiana attenuata]|uniref:uncharacterized protein LOC109211109 n=1 Tax=Nicotiana attenuata TaxID=49451 RepID=UPI0009045DCF|nr:PREDICTED: uncharacterized protein LOC109211109 [Nicotiana attenuata]